MICLNTIVKNEAQSIERMLNSVKSYIDYWIIADTGSTDNTPDIIRKVMDGVRGELLFHDWVNFGHNRELILEEAKKRDVGYCLIIDGDEELVVDDETAFRNLTADGYFIERRIGGFGYYLQSLLNTKVDWHWRGAVHNYLVGSKNTPVLNGVRILCHKRKGGKSDVSTEEKFLRDAKLLEEELEREPDNKRSRFYLAQSYRDAGHFDKAVENYKKRIDMGGWKEEVYYSYLQYATCKEQANGTFPVEDYLLAYDNRPSRVEALYALARHYRLKEKFVLGYTFARIGAYTPPTKDILFVQKDIEEWRMRDELAVSAYKVGQFKESLEVCDELLQSGKLPQNEIERVKKNREYARRRIALK